MESLSVYQQILQNIASAERRAGRSDHATLIAVSKFQTVEKLVALYLEGQRIFGENYVQELIEKKISLEAQGYPDFEFHFIGHLQSNKVKQLLPHLQTIHSVDSLKLVREIEKQASQLKKEIRIFFQVNLDEEASKGGFAPAELDLLVEQTAQLQWVKRAGWMTIPDPDKNPGTAFIKLKSIAIKYQNHVNPGLSMGMSQDYELAIENGSTFVRVGSALFGKRG